MNPLLLLGYGVKIRVENMILLASYPPTESCELETRANNDEPKQLALKKLDRGDYLFFVSSLAPYEPSVHSEYSILRKIPERQNEQICD